MQKYRLYAQISYETDSIEDINFLRNQFNDFIDSVDKQDDLASRITVFKSNVVDDPWKTGV